MRRACTVLSLLISGCFNPNDPAGSGASATDGTGETSMTGATDGPTDASMTSQGSQTSADPTSDSEPTSTTDPSAECGNGVVEGGEECDGNDFGDMSCTDLPSGIDNRNYTSGTLACTGDCTFDTSGCAYSCLMTDCALVCDPDTQLCVECIDDTHCPSNGPTPYCNDSICASCDDVGCEADLPVCAPTGVCVDAPKLVFLTEGQFPGALGGLAGADMRCNDEALAAGLPGMFRAWLSDNATAVEDRFYQSTGQYVLRDGTVIAEDWDDLTDGNLAAEININQFGDLVPADPLGVCGDAEDVWTGTFASGSAAVGQVLCGNWTDATSTGSMKGVFTESDSSWSFDCTSTDCQGPARLYCFEQ